MRRNLAEIDELLHDIETTTDDLTDPAYPEFAASEHVQTALKEARATVQTLKWAKRVPGVTSPILGAVIADDEAIGREYLRACAILQNERPVPNGMTDDEVLGVKRTLMWLKGGTLVHPMEFV